VNADECSLDGESVPVFKSDGVEIIPKSSAKYELTCSNKEGERSFDTDVGVFELSLREINPNK
jgi:hypothetical protein